MTNILLSWSFASVSLVFLLLILYSVRSHLGHVHQLNEKYNLDLKRNDDAWQKNVEYWKELFHTEKEAHLKTSERIKDFLTRENNIIQEYKEDRRRVREVLEPVVHYLKSLEVDGDEA